MITAPIPKSFPLASVQISFVHKDGDSVRIQIITRDTILCVEMTPQQFAESMLAAKRIDCALIRNSPNKP